MRILHIGDFHFKSRKNQYEQKVVVEKLIAHLSTKEKIDFVFFTGDLVHSGAIESDFQAAHDELFSNISNALKVPFENFILSPGNHDINRDECSEAIISFFDDPNKIKSNDDLNEFYLKKNKDFISSLIPSNNYYNYFNKYFSSTAEEHHPLYSIYKREHSRKKIGIISLNSSWISSGIRPDINNLLFPTCIIKDAILKIRDTNVKILLIHHPLSDFKEFNYLEIQELIHKEFNLLLSGHVHRQQISSQYAANNGIYCNTTQATLTLEKGTSLGYSIINFNLDDESTIKLERAILVKEENRFIDLESVIIFIPCGEDKYEQNRFRKKITSKYNIELNNANQLLLNYDEGLSRNFIDLFTPPVLSKNSDAETPSKDKELVVEYNKIGFDDANYLIFGKDKCGKTSLLKKLQLDLLKNYALEGIAPFFIDYKEYEKNETKFDILKLTADYYEINNQAAKRMITERRFVLLIDNFDPSSLIHPIVIKFLEANKNVKFIVCSDYLTSRIFIEKFDTLEYKKLFFKDLTRKQIRIYTEKGANLKQDDKEVVIEKICNLCTQLQLPLNYWTISLVLLIYKKSNDDYSKNLFGVLDLCVDEILNKKQLIHSKSKLKFEQYKEICSKLAHYLLTKHRKNIHSAEYHEIINFIVECKEINPRLVGEPKDIFEFLFMSGILKCKSNRYTFRLNGLFEYFLAFYIKEVPKFKKEILAEDGIYLAFKNQLVIYSGFNNKDKEFLNKVFLKTKSVFDPINLRFTQPKGIDSNLLAQIGDANDFAKTIRKLVVKQPLSHEQQDLIRDHLTPLNSESEVQLISPVDVGKVTYENLENYLIILSRVFKNSDGIEDLNLIYTIFDYILESYCCLGFYLIEEYKAVAKVENLKLSVDELEDGVIGEEILKLISKIMPILMETSLYDGVGHINLKEIILNKIEEFKKEFKSNQYKLFLLYFLLIDLDVKQNKGYVEDVFKYVTLGPLKVSTFFKLNFYLAFKAYNSKELEVYFRNKVQESQIRLDNKIDIDDLQRQLSKRTKKNIIKSKKEKND